MTQTFAAALDRMRDVVAQQVEEYRRLLTTTHEANRALRVHDVDAFERVLADQVETLRALRELDRDRSTALREVGTGSESAEIRELTEDLTRLAHEVTRARRVTRFVIERNGELVEARLALHRRAGTLPDTGGPGVDRVA
jgi:flagellar biosynthesis/type III secretory pathway chaperone